MRIAQFVARCGVASRREAEVHISHSNVQIDGRVVTDLAAQVEPHNKVTFLGKLIYPERPRLFLHYKRRGVLVSRGKDPQGRPTLWEVLAPTGLPNLINVGRLDLESEGLLLLTNDGHLARYFELPTSNIERVYRVAVSGTAALDQLRDGITFAGFQYGPVKTRILKSLKRGKQTMLEVTIKEGKNREIRRILGHLSLNVHKLQRVSYGPYNSKKLEPGELVEVGIKKSLRKYTEDIWHSDKLDEE